MKLKLTNTIAIETKKKKTRIKRTPTQFKLVMHLEKKSNEQKRVCSYDNPIRIRIRITLSAAGRGNWLIVTQR